MNEREKKEERKKRRRKKEKREKEKRRKQKNRQEKEKERKKGKKRERPQHPGGGGHWQDLPRLPRTPSITVDLVPVFLKGGRRRWRKCVFF